MIAAGIALFAADWIEVAIWAVVVLIWVIRQVASVKGQAQPPKKPAVPQPARPVRPEQKGLFDEVEQFLKEARKAAEQQQRAQGRLPQQAAERRPAKPPRTKSQQKPKPRPAPPQQQLRPEPELDEVERGTSVAEHVRQHLDVRRLDTSRFDERAEKLSQLKQTVEQDIGSHVRSVFDHQVGTMTSGSALSAAEPTAPAEPSAAQQLVAMLRDPQGMRNAIVVQEILRPPVERW